MSSPFYQILQLIQTFQLTLEVGAVDEFEYEADLLLLDLLDRVQILEVLHQVEEVTSIADVELRKFGWLPDEVQQGQWALPQAPRQVSIADFQVKHFLANLAQAVLYHVCLQLRHDNLLLFCHVLVAVVELEPATAYPDKVGQRIHELDGTQKIGQLRMHREPR